MKSILASLAVAVAFICFISFKGNRVKEPSKVENSNHITYARSYEILYDRNLGTLAGMVDDKLGSGYIPAGGITISGTGASVYYYQAVYKPGR